MRRIALYVFTLIAAMTAALFLTSARTDDPWDNYDEAAFMDMDLDENIETPRLERSEKHFVRTRMRAMATELARKKYTVDLDRDDEVIVVTVPVESLFQPNDTLLSRRYSKTLDPLLAYLKDPGMFKLVYVVHSDNTGSPDYNMELSQERINTIYDLLIEKVSEDQVIIPFAMGDTDPVESNDTRKGRAANRRVEFYFVPGPSMILEAR